MPRLDAAIEGGGHRAAVDAFFALVCPGLWAILDEDRKNRYRDNADIGFTDVQSPSLEVSAADLARVTMPVLVLSGDRSHPSLRSVAHRLSAALPDARFVQLADCGHVTYAEQPDAFAGAVSVFASELDSRSNQATTARRASASRFDVRSVDGTSLAVWVEGSGPALVLGHGSIADHTTFDPFVEEGLITGVIRPLRSGKEASVYLCAAGPSSNIISLLRSLPVVESKSFPAGILRPSTETSSASSCWPFVLANFPMRSHHIAETNAIRSRSRSTIIRTATLCTLPAESFGPTLRHTNGDTS